MESNQNKLGAKKKELRNCVPSLFFPQTSAHTVPQRLQIRVINGLTFYGVFIDSHRFLEPNLSRFQTIQLRAIAGEVGQDHECVEPALAKEKCRQEKLSADKFGCKLTAGWNSN
jgi:hypothetical protein